MIINTVLIFDSFPDLSAAAARPGRLGLAAGVPRDIRRR